MNPEIQDLVNNRLPLPAGTHIVSRIGGVEIGGTHELKDFVLAGANKVPNTLSESEPFWLHGWQDLWNDLSIPNLK